MQETSHQVRELPRRRHRCPVCHLYRGGASLLVHVHAPDEETRPATRQEQKPAGKMRRAGAAPREFWSPILPRFWLARLTSAPRRTRVTSSSRFLRLRPMSTSSSATQRQTRQLPLLPRRLLPRTHLRQPQTSKSKHINLRASRSNSRTSRRPLRLRRLPPRRRKRGRRRKRQTRQLLRLMLPSPLRLRALGMRILPLTHRHPTSHQTRSRLLTSETMDACRILSPLLQTRSSFRQTRSMPWRTRQYPTKSTRWRGSSTMHLRRLRSGLEQQEVPHGRTVWTYRCFPASRSGINCSTSTSTKLFNPISPCWYVALSTAIGVLRARSAQV